jgi:hypothetical protein
MPVCQHQGADSGTVVESPELLDGNGSPEFSRPAVGDPDQDPGPLFRTIVLEDDLVAATLPESLGGPARPERLLDRIESSWPFHDRAAGLEVDRAAIASHAPAQPGQRGRLEARLFAPGQPEKQDDPANPARELSTRR